MTVHCEQNMKRGDQQDATIRCLLCPWMGLFHNSVLEFDADPPIKIKL